MRFTEVTTAYFQNFPRTKPTRDLTFCTNIAKDISRVDWNDTDTPNRYETWKSWSEMHTTNSSWVFACDDQFLAD